MEPYLMREPEDKELVEQVWDACQKAAYERTNKIYVGPEFYQRMMREPYFGKSVVGQTTFIGNTEIVVVYPNEIKS